MSLTSTSVPNYTPQLRQLMQGVGLPSLTALYKASGLPRSHIRFLRRGQILDLPVRSLIKLSLVLQTSMPELLVQFTPPASEGRQPWPPTLFQNQTQLDQLVAHHKLDQEITALKSEYQYLQDRLDHQQQELVQDFQRTTLQTLEPLLLQWPTAAHAARNNPQAPAVKVLPLLRPLEQLLQAWQVEPIGTVGTEVPYDPQWHQLIPSMQGNGVGLDIHPGDFVRVRYVGYRQGKQLLHRAKVSTGGGNSRGPQCPKMGK